MKKIFLLIFLIIFYINLSFAGGGPLFYSGSYGLYGYEVYKDLKDLDYDFEIKSRKDYKKMINIITKYYNLYNLKKFLGEDTGKLEMNIKKIENKLNKYDLDCEYNYCFKFSIEKSANEATFDIFKYIGYEKLFYLFGTIPSLVEKENETYFQWILELHYLSNSIDSYGNYPGDDIKEDIYQIIKVKKGYKLKQDNPSLKAILTEKDVKNFVVNKVKNKKSFGETYKKYYVLLRSKDLLGEDLSNIKEEFILETGFYIKKGDKFIKIPTVDNTFFHYTLDDLFFDLEDKISKKVCNKYKKKIELLLKSYKSKYGEEKYNKLVKRILPKLEEYIFNDFVEKKEKMIQKISNKTSFEREYKNLIKLLKKEALYKCIYQVISGGDDLFLEIRLENLLK